MNVVTLDAERQRRSQERVLNEQTARHYVVKRLALEDWLRESLKAGDRKRRS